MGGPPRIEARCAVSRCRDSEDLRYLGKPICNHHWMRLSERDEDGTALCAALGIRVPKPKDSVSGETVNPLPTAAGI